MTMRLSSQPARPGFSSIPSLIPTLCRGPAAEPALHYCRTLTQATAGLLTRDTNHFVPGICKQPRQSTAVQLSLRRWRDR